MDDNHLEINPDALSPEALTGLIEEFILREGTDYGRVEMTLEAKREQIRNQVKNGLVKIAFDTETQTTTLVPAYSRRR